MNQNKIDVVIGMTGDKSSSGRKRTKKRKNIWPSILRYFLIFTLIFIISCFVSFSYISSHGSNDDIQVLKSIDPKNSIEVTVPLGSNVETIVQILNEKGLVKQPLIFKFMSKVGGYDDMYRSGIHLLSKNLDYEDMMKVLCSDPVTVTVTIPEGKNFNEIVDILESKKLVKRETFVKTANSETFDYDFLSKLPERKNKLEGYLFPDTYFFDPSAGEKNILNKFLGNFDGKFTTEFYERAKELNMTPDQIITLASIIEKETKLSEEREIVSSVFHNRLKSKDRNLKKLQSCATIQYILFNRDGKIKEKISDADTKIKDSYNTYLHEGLPPGPICNPGVESIQAALYPSEESQFYYFVAKGDGSHHFSKTLEEHNAAKNKYESAQ